MLSVLNNVDNEMDALWADCGGDGSFGTLDYSSGNMVAMFREETEIVKEKNKTTHFRKGTEKVKEMIEKKNPSLPKPQFPKATHFREGTEKVKKMIEKKNSLLPKPQFPNDGNIYIWNDGDYDWFIKDNKIIGRKANRQHYKER
jgi:hypothetical protein